MKRILAAAAVATATALVGAAAAPASAANDTSGVNCESVINMQTANGVLALGGPKADILAPTNCDHFFQQIGLIGGGN